MPKRALSLLALSALLLAGCGSPTASQASAETATAVAAEVVETKTVPMPDLAGLTASKAESVLAKDGLAYSSYTDQSGKVTEPEGDWKITGQDPAAGSPADASTVIALDVEDPVAAEKAKKAAAAKKKAEAEAKKPKVFSGYGPDVLKWKKPAGWGMVMATFEHTGGSNFSVFTLDSGLENMDLLVNTIGYYKGTVLFDDNFGGNDEDAKAFDITADGAWTVTLKNADQAKEYDGSKTITGSGDSVFYYSGDTEIFKIKNSGQSNFSVIQHGSDTDLIVNEIGSFNGTEVIGGDSWIEVTSDGSWSFKAE